MVGDMRVKVGETELGDLPAATLADRILRGKLPPHVQVWSDDSRDWVSPYGIADVVAQLETKGRQRAKRRRAAWLAAAPVSVLVFVLAGLGYAKLSDITGRKLAGCSSNLVTGDELLRAYDGNPLSSDLKYKDQCLSVDGTITDITTSDFGRVVVKFGAPDAGLAFEIEELARSSIIAKNKGDKLTLSGFCAGKKNGTVYIRDARVMR